MDEVDFYLRHRSQITEWAKLETRLQDVLRDAVVDRDVDRVARLFSAECGDAEVDFYVRNRSMITQWDAVQTVAGQALHQELLTAAENVGWPAYEHKRGWTDVRACSTDLDAIYGTRKAQVILAWTKQDLLTTRRGYPYPRIALDLHAPTKRGEDPVRDELIEATRQAAHELGMTKKDNWWVHWCMLEPVADRQDLGSYAAGCLARLQGAAERLQPILRGVIGDGS